MLNVHELEDRWFKYKLKSFIPYTVIIVSSVVIAFVVYTFFDLEAFNNTTKPVQAQNNLQSIVTKTPVAVQKKIEVAKPVEIVKDSHENDSIILSPSFDFMKNISNNTLPEYSNENRQIKEKRTPVKQNIKTQDTHKEVVKNTTVIPQENVNKKGAVNITRQNDDQDMEHVIKRFKKNSNPALSLFIAKKYYDQGEYRKAYNYALITNKINNNIESSWIVFAKSLVKLNKKDMAIKTLKRYYQHSKSRKAKILLDEIVSGKFK